MGRHSPKEIESMGMKDLQDLSDFLGEKDFIFGQEPSEIDGVLFGFMCQILYCHPKNNSLVQKVIRDHRNLVRYTERMKEKYWPDWNQCLFLE